ncbi:glucuronate isomerase [Scatolibacter rhodanostii]|uniref:glucuronate isomerase n=1 Tax=Scatolibacter rhodanostii TaxID=2014781 RepID=UPI000C07658E|nr:glucuronate isomerase [Scatolibacter rhodanostii]
MDKDFLLHNKTAIQLFHEVAKQQPIIDYHCHISPQEIRENQCFDNITQAWLYGDHYKWRAMRACGISEELITGDRSDEDKFFAYASCMPKLIGNPLYHWTHLELSTYFEIDEPLTDKTAAMIWEKANERLKKLPRRKIMEMSGVQAICTTDDPADSLQWHKEIAMDKTFAIKVLPAYRPDRALAIEKPDFTEYVEMLSKSAKIDIRTFAELKKALSHRMDVFEALGCRASDHGMTRIPDEKPDEIKADAAMQKRLSGIILTAKEEDEFRAALLYHLAKEYSQRSWVMEIHFGVLRNTNSKMYERLGPDRGFDNMGTGENIPALTRFLDRLYQDDILPRTLLFSVNPRDNAPLCTLCGAFGNLVQQGSAWWFNDSINGMREQLTTYASMLPIGEFIGFLTDSRSFLSYTRHEYFRRILCNWIGGEVEKGELTNDNEILSNLVQGICYENAARYFNL